MKTALTIDQAAEILGPIRAYKSQAWPHCPETIWLLDQRDVEEWEVIAAATQRLLQTHGQGLAV